MAKPFAVGDLVKVTRPENGDFDRGFISTIARLRFPADVTDYPYELADYPPSGANLYNAAELKRLGRKERRAYEAGKRDGAK